LFTFLQPHNEHRAQNDNESTKVENALGISSFLFLRQSVTVLEGEHIKRPKDRKYFVQTVFLPKNILIRKIYFKKSIFLELYLIRKYFF
jgi:hypothetical protein